MKAIVLSEAEAEFADAALYYLQESSEAAARFIMEVESALTEIIAFPERYPVVDLGIRAKVLKKFPFTIFYYSRAMEQVRILAIAHHARREGYWVHRV